MGRYCTNCGAQLFEGNKFCTTCGNKIEQPKEKQSEEKTSNPKYCTNCGHQIPDNASFCVECGEKIEEEIEPVQLQPEQQTTSSPVNIQLPKPKSKTMKYVGSVIVVLILLISVFYIGFMAGREGSIKTSGKTPGNIDISAGSFQSVSSKSINYNGGSVGVTDTSNPLYGLNIEIPNGAASETIDFSISYADVTEISGLPEEASIASWLINIETDGSTTWDKYKTFDKPCIVTLPYNPNIVTNEESVRFYYYDDEDKRLDSTGFLSQDKMDNTITFYSGTFSSFVAIELSLSAHELLGGNYTVDSGFRPTIDGWFIANWGSYLSSGGNCLGMTSYAKWYYAHKKIDTGIGLYEKYLEGDVNEWRDDATAIQLTTRCQLGISGIWSSLTQEEKDWAGTNSQDVAYSIIHGLIVSGEPQLIGLATRYIDGTWADGRHAVLTYQYIGGAFDIYDPNYPGTAPNTAVRQIPFTYFDGFTSLYSSGQNAGEGGQYNIFYHAGIKTFSPIDAYSKLYNSAEKNFKDDSIFPTITLTDSISGGQTPVDNDGDGIRETAESKVTISGTISGGQKEITSTLIFISNRKFIAPVTYGEFSQEVPLYAGSNDLIILATDENTWSNWAGYLSDTIKSSASIASLTFTLTWGQSNCDIDLHVLEPTINNEEGRHIYYSNKGSTYDGYPYLDIDNTQGYGPEHYYATEDMTLPNYQGSGNSLYGTYKFRVHYYDDKEDNQLEGIPTKPISWTVQVRYLAYKDPIYGTEYWKENSWSGVLTSSGSYDYYDYTSNFYSTGNAWSSIYTLEYQQPDPSDYGLPLPPQNNLPT